MEITDDKLFRLYRDNELHKYFAEICLNKICSKNSSFYQKLIGKIDTISLEQLLITLEDENQED